MEYKGVSFTVIISLDIKSSTLYAAIALISSSNFFIFLEIKVSISHCKDYAVANSIAITKEV